MNDDEVKHFPDVDGSSFESLHLSKSVLQGIEDNRFAKLTAIQSKAIPLAKSGFDLIVKSTPGSGKSTICSLIALELIDCNKDVLQAIILQPTREKVLQTCELIASLGKHIPGLKVDQCIEVLPEVVDRMICHIAIGSPEQLLSLIKSDTIKAHQVRLFVIDDAEHLMDERYRVAVHEIYQHIPQNKQMLGIREQINNGLDDFLAQYMQMPCVVNGDNSIPTLLGLKQFAATSTACDNIEHMFMMKNADLLRFLTRILFMQCVIFCNSRLHAHEVSRFLHSEGWDSEFVSGARTQRARFECLANFKQFKYRILLSTDVLAMGEDATNVDLVINYDVPNDASTYLYRIARAGRYDKKGLCISLVAEGDESRKFVQIIAEIGGAEMIVPKMGKYTIFSSIWQDDLARFEAMKASVQRVSEENVIKVVNCVDVLRSQTTNKPTMLAKWDQLIKQLKISSVCKKTDMQVEQASGGNVGETLRNDDFESRLRNKRKRKEESGAEKSHRPESMTAEQNYRNLFKNILQKFESKLKSFKSNDEFRTAWKAVLEELGAIREYYEQNMYVQEMNAFK